MHLPYFDLTGKVALITGGATGIGRGIAEGLADAGASIVIAARRLDKCEEACQVIHERTEVKTFPHRCDITDKNQIQELVEAVIKEFGHIDILVNNSGIGGSEKPVLKMSDEDWDRVIDTNLKGIFLLSRAVVSKMVEQGKGGKIINVASIGGMIGWPNMAAYCASKGGCIQLTKVMALEWVRYNIQVNAILPGYFETPMNTAFFASEAGKRVIKNNIPMRRLAQTDEIKGVAILLASQASSFMTASAVVIDGGHTCW
jgi:NAD(P)-dependent dehydrogenase (short-subunit alcohol dehydrogenase family)